MARQVAIRLGTEGKAQVVADLDAIGTAGDASAKRLANSYIKASREADQALEFAQRQATKLAALLPGLNPTKLDMAAGVRDGVGKSAEASAAVFSTAYAQMEARANALRAAIDPAWAAQQRFDREIAEARTLMAAGVITLDEYSKAAWRAHQGLDAAGGGVGKMGASAGSMRTAMAGASYQVQDFVTQVSMGANPIQAFVVQGGQMAGQFMHVEGTAGSVARFLMGPWGLALQVGLMALTPLVAKLLESDDALGKELKSLQENAAKAEMAAKAKAIFGRTEAGIIADVRALTAELEEQNKALQTNAERMNLRAKSAAEKVDVLLARRQRELAEAEQQVTVERQKVAERAGAPGELREAEARVASLRSAVADLQRQQQDAQRNLTITRKALSEEAALRANDPAATTNRKYDQLIEDAKKRATPEEAINGVLRERIRLLDLERDRKLETLKVTAQTRDTETVTSASMAKALQAQFAGITITSGDRSRAKQAELYAKYKAGLGPLAAPPGSSAHEQGRALDILKGPGVSQAALQSFFDLRGIQVKILDEGKHLHVQWEKGRFALDQYADAAKRAEQAQRALLDLTQRYDPAEAARLQFEAEAKKIAMFAPAGKKDAWTAMARAEYFKSITPAATVDANLADPSKWPGRDQRTDPQKYRDSMLGDQKDRLAMAQRELQLIGANDNARSLELEKLRLIMDVRRMGPEYAKLDLTEVLKLIEANGMLEQQLRAQQNAWRDVENIGGNAIDRLFDTSSAETWGQRLKGILGDLQNEMLKLALINPLKNMLFGQNNATLGSVFNLFKKSDPFTQGVNAGAAMLPKNAAGTQYWSGGATWLAENGPEIVDLPRGTRITPAGDTRRRLAATDASMGSVYNINVNAQDAVLAETVRAWVAEGIDIAASRGAAGGARLGAFRGARAQQRSLAGM